MNDPFVMAAWGKAHGAEGKVSCLLLHYTFVTHCYIENINVHSSKQVRMLADPTGQFADALELAVDLPVLGGKRSKRYSMVLEDGVVKEINVEPDNTGLSCSLVENIKL